MVEFKQILCPIDLSELSLRPLAYAAAFTRWYKARLTVVHVAPTFDPMLVRAGGLAEPVRTVFPMSREEVEAELRRAVEAAGAGALDVALVAEAGEAVATIVDRAVAIPADLIVMGTHGRSGFDRLLLGSVTEKVLRKTPCPILTVPPHAPAGAPADLAFKRILCPMDFSASALQALGFALDLARQAHGSVSLLNVIEWLSDQEPHTYAQFDVAGFRDHLVDHARDRMRALVADEPKSRYEVEVVAAGRAHREILQAAASKQVDLIAMGAQGRGGVGLTLFGSTTNHVVRAAACPVLTVRG